MARSVVAPGTDETCRLPGKCPGCGEHTWCERYSRRNEEQWVYRIFALCVILTFVMLGLLTVVIVK